MSRRPIVVLSLIAASSSLAACADPATAPTRPTLTAGTLTVLEAKGPATCRGGGWVSSAGRCE